jgi:hypothetical protein
MKYYLRSFDGDAMMIFILDYYGFKNAFDAALEEVGVILMRF